jgi:uncharacterized membrane protein YphA (DoxX/SURF4 family)
MDTLSYNSTLSQVHRTLRLTYGLVPIVAGLDKFTDLLTHWENYLSPGVASMLPFPAHTFMMIVGVIEIIAGIWVLAKPALWGYIIMAWLAVIAITLLASGNYIDVAVRDLTMAIGALSLARLSKIVAVKTS